MKTGDYVILKSIEELEKEFERDFGKTLYVKGYNIYPSMVEKIKNSQNKPLEVINSDDNYCIRFKNEKVGFDYPKEVVKKIITPEKDPQYFI